MDDGLHQFKVSIAKRTITGLIAPWGVYSGPESTTGDLFRFQQGTINVPDDVTDVDFLVDHDDGHRVGFARIVTEAPEGFYGTFRVLDTPEGDEALLKASTGRWRGLSLGARLEASCSCPNTKMKTSCSCEVSSADLEEVSLVRRPAFRQSIVLDVATSSAKDARVTFSLNPEGKTMSGEEGKGKGEGENKATVLTDPDAAMKRFEEELGTKFTSVTDKVIELQKSAAEGITKSVADALTSVFETMEDKDAATRAKMAAGSIKMRSEEPVYRFDGAAQSPSMVSDFWRAQTERDHDAIERLRKFQEQQKNMVDILSRIPPYARAAFTGNANFVDSTTAADVIPPGYRPDLFVNELRQGRPIVAQSSRGTITNATPFAVPQFVSSSGATADHVENVNPTPGTLTLDQTTVQPLAVSGRFELSREIVDAANPAIDAIALGAMRESYNQQTEVKAYTALNGTASGVGIITPPGADDVLVGNLRTLLARYPFTRFAAPTGGVINQTTTVALATATDTTGRPLLPSVGASNASGLGNAVNQGWFVDGLAFTPAWAMTDAASDDVALIINRMDFWTWESPLLTFRFEEKQGPAIIELALFAYYATHVLRPAGIFALRNAA